MTKVQYFEWNDMMFKRIETNGNIQWYQMTTEKDVKVKHHRADIMESLFWKYPQNEVKE